MGCDRLDCDYRDENRTENCGIGTGSPSCPKFIGTPLIVEKAHSSSPCITGLEGLLSLANELEIEGKFLDTPTGYSADKAAGQAYKECAERIRDWIEKI